MAPPSKPTTVPSDTPDILSNLSSRGAIPRKKPRMNPFDRLGAKQWKGFPGKKS